MIGWTEADVQAVYRRRGQDPMLALSSLANNRVAKRAKYGNEKYSFDGQVFDSAHEARCWQLLLVRKSTGDITDLKRQVPYVLQDGFTDSRGKKIRPIRYICDFEFIVSNGKLTVADAKGYPTPHYKDKVKMFRKRYPHINFQEWYKRGSL